MSPTYSLKTAAAATVTNAALASLRRAFGVDYALTLWPEWVWAIDNLDKAVENRGWPLPDKMIGTRIALHAGASIGGRKGRVAEREGIEAVATMAHLAGWTVTQASVHALDFTKGEVVKRMTFSEIPRSAITSTAALASCTAPSPVHSEDGWYVGDFGFRLADKIVLPEPIVDLHVVGSEVRLVHFDQSIGRVRIAHWEIG